jgi:hypothetical protein
MCKNAGKTTVLNHLINTMNQSGLTLGLTSIGRDGEAVDIVTGTSKPEIYINTNTVIATAAGLLQNCDITGEILERLGIHTPLGEIILLRAISDGFIDLAGPSTNQQIVQLSDRLKQYHVDKILIDGAISRKSLCSKKVATAVILCTGASYHKNLSVVVTDTEYTCQLLQLKNIVDESVLTAVKRWQQSKSKREKLLFLAANGEMERIGENDTLVDRLRENRLQELPYVWIEGAITDALMKPILMSNISLKNKVFMVADSSKILLGRESYQKLIQKGGLLSVAEEIKLLAVTINPYSVSGHHFDKTQFQTAMQNTVDVPVLNVLDKS